MSNARFHLVTAGAALLTSVAGAVTYMLLTGERRGPQLLGWTIMVFAITYPSLLASMRSGQPIRCTIWLKRLATGTR